MPLTARQQLVLVEAVAEIDTPLPGSGESGPRWDGLVLTIRNRLAARHRTALATGFDKPGPMLSEQQVVQILTQLVEKGLLTVARGADYTRRVSVTEAGRAALPVEE
jgi:DNA-binding PadR family transcriptional regulator